MLAYYLSSNAADDVALDLAAAAGPGTAVMAATATIPAVTGTLGATSNAASATLATNVVPPAVTGALDAAAGAATASLAATDNAAPFVIIDDRDAGFSTAGGGWAPFFGQGYQDDFTYHAAGAASETATWTFTVTPGLYRVSATWTPSSNRATNAPFTIFDDATPLATVPVDQQQAPDDFSDAGAAWEDLGGPYTISGTTLVVQLSSLADGFVIADAIRIELIEVAETATLALVAGSDPALVAMAVAVEEPAVALAIDVAAGSSTVILAVAAIPPAVTGALDAAAGAATVALAVAGSPAAVTLSLTAGAGAATSGLGSTATSPAVSLVLTVTASAATAAPTATAVVPAVTLALMAVAGASTVVLATADGSTAPGPINGGSHLNWIDRALAAHLISRGLGTPKTIFFHDAQPSKPLPDAGNRTQFCLWPGEQKANEWATGGGRYNTGADGTLKVGIWSSQVRDHSFHADRMLNSDRGIAEIGHRVIAALQEFYPLSAEGYPLASRGLRWMEQAEAVEHATSKGWFLLVITFAVQWRVDMEPVL